MDITPCPHCTPGRVGRSILTHVDTYTEYVDEPYDFRVGDIHHQHDPNPRVTTWKCKNGHEFQLRGTMPCLGCYLEQSNANRIARETSYDDSRIRSRYPSDDHSRPLPAFSNHGPDLM